MYMEKNNYIITTISIATVIGIMIMIVMFSVMKPYKEVNTNNNTYYISENNEK